MTTLQAHQISAVAGGMLPRSFISMEGNALLLSFAVGYAIGTYIDRTLIAPLW
jgi:hypothetical protein